MHEAYSEIRINVFSFTLVLAENQGVKVCFVIQAYLCKIPIEAKLRRKFPTHRIIDIVTMQSLDVDLLLIKTEAAIKLVTISDFI